MPERKSPKGAQRFATERQALEDLGLSKAEAFRRAAHGKGNPSTLISGRRQDGKREGHQTPRTAKKHKKTLT